MSITVKFSEKDLENLDNLESNDVEYVEVPYGIYEVKLAGATYRESKKGTPMATLRFKVIAGEFEGQSIFYNQIVDAVWKFKLVARLLNSLKTDVDLSSKNYVVDGTVDFDAYKDMLEAVYEDIKEKKFEYALNYNENEKGYPVYEIQEVFEAQSE